MKKIIIIAILLLAPTMVLAATPKTPVLGKAEIVSPTEIKWHFQNRDKTAVAFELWNVISQSLVLRVDDQKATFIDEKNIVPARLADYPKNWQCNYCAFKDVCKIANGDVVNWEDFKKKIEQA